MRFFWAPLPPPTHARAPCEKSRTGPTLERIFETTPPGEAWRRFYREFPNASGLTRISRAGVDEDSHQALFYLSITPGTLGGSGHFVLMQSRLGIWRVVTTRQAWLS